MGFPHGVHHPPTIRIESGLDGCVPHEFPLDRLPRLCLFYFGIERLNVRYVVR
jgi:hypothetical protein